MVKTFTVGIDVAAPASISVVTEHRYLDTKSPETSCMLELREHALPDTVSGRLATLAGPQIMLAKLCG